MQSLAEDDEPPPAGDYGFYHDVDDVAEWANMLERGILPFAGGWVDQPDTVRADINTYLSVRARIKWEIDKGLA